MSLPDDATPQVDLVIALAMAEHPGYGRTEQAEYYEAVHMELAPLARRLERDARRYRRQLHQLRVDLLSVMPENWREDPDWVALADNQKLTTGGGTCDTAAMPANAPHEGPGGFSPGPLDAVVGRRR